MNKTSKRKKHNTFTSVIGNIFHHFFQQKSLVRIILFVLTFVWWEFLLHMILFSDYNGLFYPLLVAVFMGVVAGLLTTAFRPLTNTILTWVILIVRFFFFAVYLIFWKVFATAFSFALIIGGNEGVNALTEFTDLVITALQENVLNLFLFILPLIVFVIFTIRNPKCRPLRPKASFAVAAVAVILTVVFTVQINQTSTGSYSPQALYSTQWVKDLALRKLGFDLTIVSDLKYTLFPDLVPQEDFVAYTVPSITPTSDKLTDIVDIIMAYPDLDSEEIVSLYFSDNILDFDFAALAESETDSNYLWLNQYMASAEATSQNAYTGYFEGYNVILITAESFSPWAVDEELTPTLYKLVNEGFVMNNFYIPAFNNTSDGEYMVCMGLIPNGQGNRSFQKTVDNDLALCLGNILSPLGYATYAYHDHTYTYYNRDQTHPNMGYTYTGYGNGLDITYSWPESDLEMMQATVDDYIYEEHFHAYYMTVSGHMNYSFTGNAMSAKHKSAVADLDMDESLKAYIACNMELDAALEYLISRLEEAGVAENTVIALAPDHYPYALEDVLTDLIGEESAQWYGLYESTMILWSASMTEPVYVDKVCSSIDIVPTLCNLLGLDYDSRLYIGQDILSDSAGLVVFSNKSFVTDYLIYDTITGTYKLTTDTEVPDGYVEAMQEIVNTKWTASSKILTTDYYGYLKEKLGLTALVTKED